MKKIFCFAAVLIAGLFLAGAFSKNNLVCVKGYVHLNGNEPLTYEVFETVEGDVYHLSVEKNAGFAMKDILLLTGNLLEVTGTVEAAAGDIPDKRFVVQSFRQVKQ